MSTSNEESPQNPEIGYPFSGTNIYGSPGKFNAKTQLTARASYFLGYAPIYPGQPARVIGPDIVGMFKPDRSYHGNTDGSGWLSSSLYKHKHLDDTEEDGGTISDINRWNLHTLLQAAWAFPTKAMFKQVSSGTSQIVDNTTSMDLVTENATNAYVNARLQGGILDTSKPSGFAIYGYMNAGQMMSVKLGVGMENVADAEPLDRRFGLEACDTGNQPRNYNLVSGDGNSWNMDPTTEAVAQTVPRGYRLDHVPLQFVKFSRFVGGVETITLKENNIAGSGFIDIGKVLSIGIRTNENTAKNFLVSLLKLEARIPTSIFPNPLD